MKICEQFIQGKHPDASRLEDGYIVTTDFAVVVDGSTSKQAKAFSDTNVATSFAPTGGQTAMRTVLATVETLPADASATLAVAELTAALRRLWPIGAEACAALRPTCSVVVYSQQRREVWMVGDCQCRFNGRTRTNPKLIDTILARARSEAIRYLLNHGHDAAELQRHDIGRALIYDALREQTNFQNDENAANPYRYAVIDGKAVDPSLIRIFPVENASRLILATDGYPVVADTLAESETILARLLHDDPLCIDSLVATKCLMVSNCSFDDRTYLSLDI